MHTTLNVYAYMRGEKERVQLIGRIQKGGFAMYHNFNLYLAKNGKDDFVQFGKLSTYMPGWRFTFTDSGDSKRGKVHHEHSM